MQGDSLTQQSPAARAAAWLVRHERNRLNAIDWIDRSWLPDWFDAALPPDEAMRSRDHACALASALALPVFDARDLWRCIDGGKRAPVRSQQSLALAALPMCDQLRLLRVRSLVFRRAEVRRVLDLERRSRWAAMIGPDGAAHLRWLQSLADAPEMAALSRTLGAPPLDALDETTLAWEGYCLLERDGVLAADSGGAHPPMLRFGLPRSWTAPPWLARCERHIDERGSEHLLDRLPILFPEHAS
jgi:type III secretion system HrpB4-like protein